MAQISVTIDNKTYRMACEDGQDEHIKSLAVRLDETIQTLLENFGEIGDHRLAIMAGIMMADALSEEERKNQLLKAELADLREGKDALHTRCQQTEETLCQTILSITERLEKIALKLNSQPEKTANTHHAGE